MRAWQLFGVTVYSECVVLMFSGYAKSICR